MFYRSANFKKRLWIRFLYSHSHHEYSNSLECVGHIKVYPSSTQRTRLRFLIHWWRHNSVGKGSSAYRRHRNSPTQIRWLRQHHQPIQMRLRQRNRQVPRLRSILWRNQTPTRQVENLRNKTDLKTLFSFGESDLHATLVYPSLLHILNQEAIVVFKLGFFFKTFLKMWVSHY